MGLGLAHEEEAGGFVLGFLVFEVGVGVGDDAGAGVEVDGVVLADGGADGDVVMRGRHFDHRFNVG